MIFSHRFPSAEVPEVPYGLKVLDKSGRSVQLSWAAPYDGNSPIKRYVIEYKISKGSWETDIDRVLVPGSQQNVAGVFNLRPATTYHLRIVAENEIGASDPSDTVTIITAEEAPSGPPTSIRVDDLDQHTLKVSRNFSLLSIPPSISRQISNRRYLFKIIAASNNILCRIRLGSFFQSVSSWRWKYQRFNVFFELVKRNWKLFLRRIFFLPRTQRLQSNVRKAF